MFQESDKRDSMKFSEVSESAAAKTFSSLPRSTQLVIGRRLGLLTTLEVSSWIPHVLKVMLMFARMGKYGESAWRRFESEVHEISSHNDKILKCLENMQMVREVKDINPN